MTFSDGDRRAQLKRLSNLSYASRWPNPFVTAHGESYSGDLYAVVGDGATGLLTHGFGQADLTELSSVFPSGPGG
jgi:hypothetical protein